MALLSTFKFVWAQNFKRMTNKFQEYRVHITLSCYVKTTKREIKDQAKQKSNSNRKMLPFKKYIRYKQ